MLPAVVDHNYKGTLKVSYCVIPSAMELLLRLQIPNTPNIIHHILVGTSTVVTPTKRLILLICLMCPGRIVLTPSKATKLVATMENADLVTRNTILSTLVDHQGHMTEKKAHIEATIIKVRKYRRSIRKGLHHRSTTLNNVLPLLSSRSVWETGVLKPWRTSPP